MRLPRILQLFVLQSLAWTALCLLVELGCRATHLTYPYTSPFMPRNSLFEDFTLYIPRFANFRSPAFFTVYPPLTYPAPLVALYKLFLTPQPTHIRFAVLRYLCLILLTTVVALQLFRTALIRRGILPRHATYFVSLVALCSFPLWFELHRANVEVVVWIATTAGVLFFVHERPRAASLCLGIAAALKIYPVIFFALFLTRRLYRELLFGLGTAAALTLVSLAIISPSIVFSWHATQAAVVAARDISMLQIWPLQIGFDHSLFALLKRLGGTLPPRATLSKLLTLFTVSVGSVAAAVFLLRIRRLPVLNQILYLSTAMVLLPPVSYDYTLLHLYTPFALLSFAAIVEEDGEQKTLFPIFALLAFVLSFQSEFILGGYRIAAQCKAVALLALLLLASRRTLPGNRQPVTTRVARG